MSSTDNKPEKRYEKMLEKLTLELDRDTKIKPEGIKGCVAENPRLYSKWNKYHANTKFHLAKLEKSLKEMKTNEYLNCIGMGKDGIQDTLFTKSEAKFIINGIDNVVDLEEEIDKVKTILDFISNAMSIINSRSYALHTYIEYIKFEQGII